MIFTLLVIGWIVLILPLLRLFAWIKPPRPDELFPITICAILWPATLIAIGTVLLVVSFIIGIYWLIRLLIRASGLSKYA